jgi:C4-dicarboxylate-specific signal transduction histidine kinase
LIAKMAPDEIARSVFDLVNQFNPGLSLISELDEQDRVAELNLRAARKAKASTAYTSACIYLTAAMDLVGRDAWERRYDVERIVRADAAAKKVTLQREVPTLLPTVTGNRTQLIEALMNLVLNAFDSVCESAGGPREVEMRAIQPEAGCVRVSVRDS